MSRISKFGNFAASQLDTSEFVTSYDDDNSQIFHTSLDSTLHLLRWTLNARNTTGTKFSFHAGFVDIFSPNAFADQFEHEHYIGLHTAMFVSISEFAMFCFAQRDFFTEIGNSKNETSPEPWDHRVPGLWLLDNTKHGGHVENIHSQTLIPKDSERYHYSTCLSFLMARFVWLHELSHCFNGHVDLVQKRNIVLRLYEIAPMQAVIRRGVETENAQAEKLLKHLEHDADQSAFWGGVNLQLGELENIQTIIEMPQEQRLKLVLFASYAMPWLFEQYQAYLGSDQSQSHPEPIDRLEYLFETAKTRLLSQHPELAELNQVVLNQFDMIRKKIPSLYRSDSLKELFARAAMNKGLSGFDEYHTNLLDDLKAYEFKQV
jgi:hypothetical protein